jgi:glycosyltransferase involved in cell wall biosynthesis
VALLKRLQAAGHEVEVFTSAYRGGGGSGSNASRYIVEYFGATRGSDARRGYARSHAAVLLCRVLPLFYVIGGLWGIWRLTRRRHYDIIHVHWPVPHVLFGWLGRRTTRPPAKLVTSWYGVELRWVQSSLPWLRGFVKWALRTSDAVVAISSYTAREVARFARVPVRVIPYTLGFDDATRPHPARLQRGARQEFRIVFVGRLVERKGVKHLIDAVGRLPVELRSHLTVIGEGPERPALDAQVRAAGLERRVEIRGRVSEQALHEAYADSDVMVLPSILDARGDTEGLGVVLLEAMSYGVPVIASDIGGITDIVENEKSGLLVPPADPEQLARALERLARDPALAKRLGDAGEQRVRHAFGWPEIMAKWAECYGSLGRRRTGTASAAEQPATPPREPVR